MRSLTSLVLLIVAAAGGCAALHFSEIIQVLGEIPKTASENPIACACIERLRESGVAD
ncbi:hypothetical protein GGD63_003894 [Bradyrhizobium sp. cir1]|uniref:hypothetical protein n=1 Tax=Bradyrhizobium sp. cir1 TaxID=1445730 RepID=UPI001605B01C|nr:hypothetical protein [Bradyrhizobium sp. cir1]MBB4371097.1 hypothetical protein [Bradyrhizobium sp. cir1]